jgi:hypothetical protein
MMNLLMLMPTYLACVVDEIFMATHAYITWFP